MAQGTAPTQSGECAASTIHEQRLGKLNDCPRVRRRRKLLAAQLANLKVAMVPNNKQQVSLRQSQTTATWCFNVPQPS